MIQYYIVNILVTILSTYLSIRQGTEFDELYDAIWNACLTQSLEVLDDVMSLETNADGSIQGISGQLVL
jgi:hypothetical protein